MKSIFILLSLGMILLLSGCIQPESGPQVKEALASEEWKPNGVVGPNEYARSVVLHGAKTQGYSGGDLEISWKNDDQYLYMALNGSTNGWISVGFEPSEWMKDADIIIGSIEEEKPVVLDEYSTGNYGPHEKDVDLGGTDDILEFGGKEENGFTTVEFKRKLNTGDRFDKIFEPGQEISMIWAMAASENSQTKHNMAKGEAILTLQASGTGFPTSAALTAKESEGILFIEEEEKAARDLYNSLFAADQMTIFKDTAQSEQNHMDSVRPLIERYGLGLSEKNPGRFNNQSLQKIYDQLKQKGIKSPNEALSSAASFEELSIIDLQRELEGTNNEDIRTVYQGLLAGSRKHLRSFAKELKAQGEDYSPQLMNQDEFNKIMG
ncbi:MAG: DUF2202 domain-containing protein [Methanotrichaceae archaeon]|nr:DUF2202 domain-containing protein [Methanotrichaceae archaeon]